MRVFWMVAKHSLQAVLIVLTLAIAASALWHAMTYFLPPELSLQLQAKARVALGMKAYPNMAFPSAVYQAEKDHRMVGDWVMHCMGSPTKDRLEGKLQGQLLGYSNLLTAPVYRKADPLPTPLLYSRLLDLSKRLIEERWNVDENVTGAYTMAKTGAYLSILIGFLTTVVIGLGTLPILREAPRTASSLKAAAFVLPALGTAVAAIIAFDDPSGNLARQSQVALGLEQLHGEIATTVWKLPCAVSEGSLPQETDRSLNAWSLRLRDILGSAGDSRAQSGKKEGPQSTH
jgi:hypothetical protein